MKGAFRLLLWPFRQRWLVSLLGAACVMLLLWHLGPLIPVSGGHPLQSERNRWLGIGLIALLWVLAQGLRIGRAWLKNRQLVAALTEKPAPSAEQTETEEEVGILHDRLREALATLDRSQRGRLRPGGRMLYELPWYLMIGPPGSGKTTALLSSGLRFPGEERFGRGGIKGIAGTRYCDWFLTEDAVLIDTAGRYATQTAHAAVDGAAWLGFLDLLKRYRPRQPLNGVIVAFDLPRLLDATAGERNQHAGAVRQRLQELRTRLGVDFPAYVMFTKLDLLAGFRETFEELGQPEREQVWGVTFTSGTTPPPPTESLPRLASELDRLVSRLQQQVLPRMEAETDLRRRGLILGFPAQLAAAAPILAEFVRTVFEPTRYEPPVMLRGVYLTSGTQEETPIDRIMSRIAGSFGLNPQVLPAFSREGRSYFVTGLLRRVIFAEAGLAGTDVRHERRRRLTEAGVLAGIALATTGIAAAWAASYANNRALIETVRQRADAERDALAELSRSDPSLLAVVSALNALRGMPAGYAERDRWPALALRGGLYQGGELGSAAISAYRRALNEAFLPRLRLRLEARLAGRPDQPEDLFRTLKAYLMLGEPQRLDPAYLREWFDGDWNVVFATVPASTRTELTEHLKALLELGFDPVPPDEAIAAAARRSLAEHSPAMRAYAQLREAVPAAVPWRLTDHAPATAARVFRRNSGRPLSEPIPALFTRPGFEEMLRTRLPRLANAVAQEAWVLGTEQAGGLSVSELENLQRQVLELYLTDYARIWGEFVDGLDLVPTPDLPRLVELLSLLTVDHSPLRAVLTAVAAQTRLAPDAAEGSQGWFARLPEPVQRWAGQLLNLAGGASRPPLTDIVDRRFATLHAVVRAQGDQPPPLDGLIAQLRELLVHANALLNTGNRGEAVIGSTAAGGGGLQTAIQRLQITAQQTPGTAGRLAQAAAGTASAVAFGTARQQIQSVWATQYAAFCRENLAGRYPLQRGSNRDATLADFTRFFGPNGMADEFYKQYLRGFVDNSVRPWRLLQTGGTGIGISASGVQQLERASQLRDAFFEGGSQQVQASFEIAPVSLDQKARRALLALGEQSLTYDHGPARAIRFRWPGADGGLEARLVLTAISDGRTEVVSASGTWAWFRLLDRAAIERHAVRDSYRVTFRAGDMSVTYEMRPGSVDNPLSLRERPGFQCVDRM